MYLSRMHLNPRRRGTRLLVGNPQTVHAAVMSSFPPTAHGEGRVLWRMDRDGDHLALYILSPTAPSFEHIQEQAGWSNQESWDVRPYGRVLDRITLALCDTLPICTCCIMEGGSPSRGAGMRTGGAAQM